MPHIIVVIVTLSQTRVGQCKRCKIGFGQRRLNSQTNAMKAELYSIIQRLKPIPSYVVDDMGPADGEYLV